MAAAAAGAPSWVSDDDGWEACNDDGFVFKRRKRTPAEAADLSPASSSAPPSNTDADLRRNRRTRKKLSLVALRDKYRKELEQWEHLAAALQDGDFGASSSRDPSAAAAAENEEEEVMVVVGETPFHPLIEELLLQVEAQEGILRKLSDLCDMVDSLCDAREEALAKSLAGLPVWASPRSLMAALSD